MKLKRLMTRLLRLSIGLLFLSGCHSVQLPDVCPKIELPGSGEGYERCTVSHRVKRYSREEWDSLRRRLISISSEDWAKIKAEFLKHCVLLECKEQASKLDALYNVIDSNAR